MIERTAQKGFTLIELIVVFSIISILSTFSIASFVNYSRAQTLDGAKNDVISMLNVAKSRSQSQIIPTGCSGTLLSYSVTVYKDNSGAPTYPIGSYVLTATCSGNATPIQLLLKKLTSGLNFDATLTTISTVSFSVLTGAVTGTGNIVINYPGFGLTSKTISVSSVGVIQ